MGKLLKNFFYNGTYNLLLVIIPVITMPYLTRTMGKTALGIDGYVVSIVSLVKLFGALGINLYSNREIAYHRDDKEKLTKTYYEIQKIRWSLCIIVVALYLLVASRTEYKVYFLIQTFTIIGYFIDITWVYVGREDMKLPVIRNVIVKLVQTALIFILIKSPDDLALYVWISAVGTFLSAVCMYTQVGKLVGKYNPKELEIRKHIKPILALFLPQAASSIYVQFDRTMIGMLSEDIGYVSIYDYAENLVKLPIYFISALSLAMAPRVSNEFAKNNMESSGKLLKGELKYIFLFIFPLMLGMIAIANNLVIWFLGEAYEESALVIMVLAPIIFAKAMGEVFGTQLMVSVNETKGMTIAFSCGAVCNLIANAILIPKYNAAGAAIGTVIAELMVVCIEYQYAKKYIGKLGVAGALPKKLIAAAIMFAVVWPMNALAVGFGTMVLQIGVGAIVYFVILLALRDSELYSILSMIKNKGALIDN